MTPKDAIAYLHALPRFAGTADAAYKPGLERMERLMVAMDRPHEAFKSIHIAGTNGKGSTASLIASVAAACGYRVGLHTSPHLRHVTERMRIDGVPVSEDWLARAVERFRETFGEVEPSFFEATVALSFLYFAEEAVDWAVVEVGLGGRLDATNVLRPRLACITSIGRDHTALLGETLAEIAREKAGIIKHGTPALTAASQPEAVTAIEEVATARKTPLHRVQEGVHVLRAETSLEALTLSLQTPLRRYDELRVGLPGLHQQPNALLAVRAAELLFEEVQRDAKPLREGLREVRKHTGVRGRFEVLQDKPLVVADVAHNPDGLATALELLRPTLEETGGRLFVLFGLMRDKDLPAMGQLLSEAQATVWPVHLEDERALSAGELGERLSARGVAVGPAGSVAEGLERFRQQAAPADALLVTGSHQVVAAALQVIDGGRRTADRST